MGLPLREHETRAGGALIAADIYRTQEVTGAPRTIRVEDERGWLATITIRPQGVFITTPADRPNAPIIWTGDFEAMIESRS